MQRHKGIFKIKLKKKRQDDVLGNSRTCRKLIFLLFLQGDRGLPGNSGYPGPPGLQVSPFRSGRIFQNIEHDSQYLYSSFFFLGFTWSPRTKSECICLGDNPISDIQMFSLCRRQSHSSHNKMCQIHPSTRGRF